MKEYYINYYWYDEKDDKEPIRICQNKCKNYSEMIQFLY